MPAIIKITEPNDDGEGYKHYCNNAAYHDSTIGLDLNDCPTCEKIMTRYYVKYLESLLDKNILTMKNMLTFLQDPDTLYKCYIHFVQILLMVGWFSSLKVTELKKASQQ